MKKSNNKKQSLYRLLFWIFLIVFLIVAVMSVNKFLDRKKAEKVYEELQQAALVPEDSETAEMSDRSENESEENAEASAAESSMPESDLESLPDESSAAESLPVESSASEEAEASTAAAAASENVAIPAKNIDWTALQAQNADVYAWLYVPGTLVDYPVLQHPGVLDYYLNRNMDLSEGYPGCLYTDYINTMDFMDTNTVIYGHNMYDNLMFTTLHWFEGKEFFEEHPYFYIYTPNGNFAYKIFAAYKASNLHQLLSYSYASDLAVQMYFDQIWTYRDVINHFRYDVELTPSSKIVTLSTCMDQDHDHRYLVQGIFLGKY
ncbi:MAG: class B sortase [Lachnospiraceae bacterium]|nr:class B sortase [Lachnospiraceae bacterium]